MLLDLHSHSVKSDDGRAKVQNYCQWIRTRDVPIDGFVLTEHRQFDFESDYSDLAAKFDLTILKASEVETEYGHVLVYGVTPPMTEEYDFSRIGLKLADVIAAANKHGGIAIPCHPGRTRVGMCAHIDTYGIPKGVTIVEVFNGGSRDNEDDMAHQLAEDNGYLGIGGSDAHIVSHVGKCATRFPHDIHTIDELVAALKAGEFEAVNLRQ